MKSRISKFIFSTLALASFASLGFAEADKSSGLGLSVDFTGQEQTGVGFGVGYACRNDKGVANVIGPEVILKNEWPKDDSGKTERRTRYEYLIGWRQADNTQPIGTLTHFFAGATRLHDDEKNQDKTVPVVGMEMGISKQVLPGENVTVLTGLRYNGVSLEKQTSSHGTNIKPISVYAGLAVLFIK